MPKIAAMPETMVNVAAADMPMRRRTAHKKRPQPKLGAFVAERYVLSVSLLG